MLGGVRSSAFFSGKLFFYDIVTVFSESQQARTKRYVLRRASEGEGRAAHASYQEAGKHRALRRRANIAT